MKKGTCFPGFSQDARKVAQGDCVVPDQALDCQSEEIGDMTFDEALVVYKTYARAEGKSQQTVKWVAESVGYFSRFLGPERQDIAQVTANDLRRFIIDQQEKNKFSDHPFNKTQDVKLSPHTIDTYCRGIRSFFSFLKREDFTSKNAMAKAKTPKVPEKVVPTFSEKDITKLLAQANRGSYEGFRNYCIMLTLVDTGIRLSELANLKVGDIYYDQNLLRVMGKGQRERFVPFGRRVAKALMKYQMKYRPEPFGTENFWLRRDGQPLLPHRIQKIIRMYGRKAGLERCYAHKLRHTSSVMYLRNGGDVFSLQKKLGHRSLVMTRHYSNLADSDVRAQHLRYGVADRLKI
ncbi:tyrosine-type recombinase/integrase [Chloroflexota bacterium]